VRLKGLWGYIDLSGKLVVPAKFDESNGFKDGLAPVRQGRLWGFIDKSGEFVIQPQFETAHSFSDRLADVQLGSKWGYIDQTGRITNSGPLRRKWPDARRFGTGKAGVQVGLYKTGWLHCS